MQILHTIDDLAFLRGPVQLAIGFFDGVHLGHRAVIEAALRQAAGTGGDSAVVTFDPHPQSVLRPGEGPRLLTSTDHRIRLIDSIGAPNLLLLHFTREFAQTTPEQFIALLSNACKPLGGITVGEGWSFGKARSGNITLLGHLGPEFGFDITAIAPVAVAGEVVSSTRIREQIQEGRLAEAAKLLGRPFSLQGTVAPGEQLGRKLGIPTANIYTHKEQFPADGVYAGYAMIGSEAHPAVINIGVRPTVAEDGRLRTCEAHLLDFSGDLYGTEIEIVFRERIREERKFDSLDALAAQIRRDIETARTLLAKAG